MQNISGYPYFMKPSGQVKPRILALDMDDTLLRSDLSISPRIRSAIKFAGDAGVIVVLASSRVPAAMEKFARLLGLNDTLGYLLSYNGALIQESHTGKIVHDAPLERETVLAVCDLADAEGFALQMYEDDIMYVSRKNEYTGRDQKLTGIRQVVVENFRDMVSGGCYKLTIPGDPELIVHMEKLVRSYFEEKLSLFISRPYFLDLMSEGTDKGNSLAKIAEINGVSAAETIAIGNSMNDEAMIRWAGIGVAMANSDENIKKIATLVTKNTNDEDGVLEVIEKYILAKRGPFE